LIKGLGGFAWALFH